MTQQPDEDFSHQSSQFFSADHSHFLPQTNVSKISHTNNNTSVTFLSCETETENLVPGESGLKKSNSQILLLQNKTIEPDQQIKIVSNNVSEFENYWFGLVFWGYFLSRYKILEEKTYLFMVAIIK